MLENPFRVISLVSDALNLLSPMPRTLLPYYVHSQGEVCIMQLCLLSYVMINGINDSCILQNRSNSWNMGNYTYHQQHYKALLKLQLNK